MKHLKSLPSLARTDMYRELKKRRSLSRRKEMLKKLFVRLAL